MLDADPTVFLMAMITAAIIYLIAYLSIVRKVMKKANEKLVNLPEKDEVNNKVVVYIISALFWPAALIIGNNYLERPETARTGRVCIIIFLCFTGIIVLFAIIATYLTYIYLPEIIEFLKNYNLW